MPIALEFFVHYAYGLLFLWVLIEQLGVPVPSIPLLLTAGTLSATHRIHLFPAFLAVLAACVLSDSLWYFAGRRYGNRVLKLVCRLSMEASACVKKTEAYFGKHGASTLLFAKFVPGLSAVAPPIAGQTGMSYGRFLAWDLTGSLIWSGAFLLAGAFFGDLAKRSTMFFHLLGQFAVVIFITMVVGLIVYRIVKQQRFLSSVRKLRLDASELKEMLEEAAANHLPAPVIIDLRHPLDYLPDPRVLPGSLRIAPAELERHSEVLPRDRDVVLYCTCPSEETSAKLALRLHKLGIYRVRPLRGGFEGWRDAGYPLVDYVEPETAIIAERSPAGLVSAA